MGCGASKQATGAVSESGYGLSKPVLESGATTSTTQSHLNTTSPMSEDNNMANTAAQHQNGEPSSSSMRRDNWKTRPGYSSGASSYSGSDDVDNDNNNNMALSQQGLQDDTVPLDRSRHTDILGLSTLRQEMAADGDLAKSLVRIETPFDTPIEEIYDGVLTGPKLGSGVSGVVRLVKHKATGVQYAVKCLDLDRIDTTEGLRQLREEIFIMCQLDHPNIVRIEEVYESANEIYIVQELAMGGDLFDRLDEQPDYHYTEAQCAKLVKQMLSALRYLHSKGIVHRDLKLENFIFSSVSADSELKMIDFGLSKHFEVGECHCEIVGTAYTVAPEIIKGNYDEKCDLWALGVITYLLLSGETPFGGLDDEGPELVRRNIMRGSVHFEPSDVWELVSEEGKAFVKTLLMSDPKKRPNAKEAQRSEWIQVWSKKDVSEGTLLNSKTVRSLVNFKESSDMQKLLSEVLSFTLLPEQIVDLRIEFEKMDTDGDGEISLKSLQRVLMQTAEVGALGALTEKEVEDIFDSMRVRQTHPTIRWHEFLAAGLSQARVDDRNLRLAFDRLDHQRKGFISFEDLAQLLGNSAENEALETMWLDSLEECKSHWDKIVFSDFKKLMKGQPKEGVVSGHAPGGISHLAAVPEGRNVSTGLSSISSGVSLANLDDDMSGFLDGSIENPRTHFKKARSRSYEQKASSWDGTTFADEMSSELSNRESVLGMVMPTYSHDDFKEITNDKSMSALMVNRALYRKHREMRIAVLDASKQFDKKRNDFHTRSQATKAGLIMKRGSMPPVELNDSHTSILFEQAAKRCGRTRRKKNRTVSDITGMMLQSKA